MRLVDTPPALRGAGKPLGGALASLPTPCYLLDEAQLRRNGRDSAGAAAAHRLQAFLGAERPFSNFDVYPLLAPYLAGTEASGLYESRLGQGAAAGKGKPRLLRRLPGGRVRTSCCSTPTTSCSTPRPSWPSLARQPRRPAKASGLRVNPECSTQEGHAIYDPCAPGSRLGTTRAQWDAAVAAHPELPTCWTASTSTPFVSRTPTPWP